MKKYAYVLTGFFMVIIVAFAFAACELKSKNGGGVDGGGSGEGTVTSKGIVGTWRCESKDYYGKTVVITAVVKDDHTGVYSYTESGYGTTNTNFSWNYNTTTTILTIVMEDSYYVQPVDYKVNWFGDDRFYLAYVTSYGTVYEDEIMGPFIRQSGGGGGSTTPSTADSQLIGTWEWNHTDSYGNFTVTLVINSDHTGTQTYSKTGYGYTTYNFSWNYNASTEIVTIVLETGYGTEVMKYKLEWYGTDRFYTIYMEGDTVYEEYMEGPFVRKSGSSGSTTPSAAEKLLIGTWKYQATDYYGTQITITAVLKADHTGTQTYTEAGYGTSTMSLTWNYNETTEILTLILEDTSYGYSSGLYPVKYKVQWYGNDRFYLAYVSSYGTVYEDEIMGPFVRQ